MKRFGRYDNDFNNLFECYSKVSPGLIVERELPSATREILSDTIGGTSFNGLKNVKVFLQRPGRGADLSHLINLKSVDSDDGDGGAILTGSEDDKTFNIVTNKKSAQVKMIDQQGNVENDFVTNISPRFDGSTGELTIIQVEEL
jgi:hypothetical protein